jgi:hypothetical protein
MHITSINPQGNYNIQGDALLNMLDQVATLAVEKYIASKVEKEEKLYTTDEAMIFLRVRSKATMNKYIKQHNLSYIKGNPNLFKQSDLEQLLFSTKYIK